MAKKQKLPKANAVPPQKEPPKKAKPEFENGGLPPYVRVIGTK